MLHSAQEEAFKSFRKPLWKQRGRTASWNPGSHPKMFFFPCDLSRLSGFCWQWEEDEGRFRSAGGSQFTLRFVMGRKARGTIPPPKNQEFWEGGTGLSPDPQATCRAGGAQTCPNIELLKAPAGFSPGICAAF